MNEPDADHVQDRAWALYDMGLLDIQDQPDEIRAAGFDPDTYEFLPSEETA